MRALRPLATLAAMALIALLVARLPADVYGATLTFLLIAAAVVLLLVAAALFLVPARRLLANAFMVPLRVPEGVLFAMVPEDEMRGTLKPLIAAGILLAVATLAALLRL